MKIVLAAEEAAGVHALRLVLGSRHRLHAVLTADDLTTDGARAATAGRTVAAVAREHGATVLPAARVKDPAFAAEVGAAEVDVLLNVHSLHIIAPEVLAAPRFGCFNLHPGPLPQYAGMNAPSWALYHGEPTHAVTLHWMSAAVDAGAVAYTHSFDITPGDTGLTVSVTCARRGVELVARLLDELAADPAAIPRVAQDLAGRRWFGRRPPHDGWLQWAVPCASVLDFVRACDYGPFTSPWGRPRLRAGDGTVLTAGRATATTQPCTGVAPGTVGEVGPHEALVATSDFWVLLRDLRPADVERPTGEILVPGEVLTAPDQPARHAGTEPGSVPSSLREHCELVAGPQQLGRVVGPRSPVLADGPGDP